MTTGTEIDALEPLWLALPHHRQAVTDFDGYGSDDLTPYLPA